MNFHFITAKASFIRLKPKGNLAYGGSCAPNFRHQNDDRLLLKDKGIVLGWERPSLKSPNLIWSPKIFYIYAPDARTKYNNYHYPFIDDGNTFEICLALLPWHFDAFMHKRLPLLKAIEDCISNFRKPQSHIRIASQILMVNAYSIICLCC